jgi:lipopolysaccharide export system protein LptA
MDVKANTVLVEGNVKVVQGKTIVTGQKLVADLNTSKSEMSGGRVKGNFAPGE